jgi:hypothetical protein
MTRDEVEVVAHELAKKIAAVVTDEVKKEFRERDDVTIDDVNNVVLTAALFFAIDAVANIKCKDCRRKARKHTEKVLPRALRELERDGGEDQCGLTH